MASSCPGTEVAEDERRRAAAELSMAVKSEMGILPMRLFRGVPPRNRLPRGRNNMDEAWRPRHASRAAPSAHMRATWDARRYG